MARLSRSHQCSEILRQTAYLNAARRLNLTTLLQASRHCNCVSCRMANNLSISHQVFIRLGLDQFCSVHTHLGHLTVKRLLGERHARPIRFIGAQAIVTTVHRSATIHGMGPVTVQIPCRLATGTANIRFPDAKKVVRFTRAPSEIVTCSEHINFSPEEYEVCGTR
jgi:hypothetical protein